MFKYEGFQVGELIRAQDFEDRPGRGACYVEGRIIAVCPEGTAAHPFAHYVIRATSDVWDGQEVTDEGSRKGVLVTVPMESNGDWDGRVTRQTCAAGDRQNLPCVLPPAGLLYADHSRCMFCRRVLV